MDIYKELSKFELIKIEDSKHNLDTSLFDNYIQVFTKIAKSNQKIKQSIDFSVDEITSHLKQNEDIFSILKKEKSLLSDDNEKLIRIILEIMDIITNFRKNSMETNNSELLAISETMIKSLDSHINNIGMNRINTLGEVPDSLYHFVIDAKKINDLKLKDKIIEVVREGYILNGQVIRKADVIIGK